MFSEKIRSNILPILLAGITIILFFTNYSPGTFLSGWDTLHPEFNFPLAFQREIDGVFRENQGLGAVAAHSDMSDLPHIAILYLLHFVLPMSFLRYSFIFLTLIAGSMGMYFFLNRLVLKNKFASFLGALFYLLNPGTMQQFVVPLEMFVVQFATLPWLFLTGTNYIYKSNNKYFLYFAFVVLLSTPIAFGATLWYFEFFAFLIYILALTFKDIIAKNPTIIKKVLIIIVSTIAINLFWILPNLYFITNYGARVENANINQHFSEEAFLYNKAFGDLGNIALFKNFLFGWSVYSGNNSFSNLLSPWIAHLDKPIVYSIGYIFALMGIMGLLYSIAKKNKILIALLIPLLLALIFQINDNPPTSFLYNILKTYIPLFSEAFRFPQDKALGVFVFLCVTFFSYFQIGVMKFLSNSISQLKPAYVVVISILICFYMFPSFTGNFISPYMRVNIPKSYFYLFDFFEKQDPTARIANLPIHSLFGWEYYDWHTDPTAVDSPNPSFQGAGFIWFGIKQPILNRDFDRWHPANEQYYREMSEAIYSEDPTKLTNVLQKYNISFITLDKNIIAPEQKRKTNILFLPQIQKLFDKTPSIKQVAQFGNILVYKTSLASEETRIIKNPPALGPVSRAFYDDFAYAKYKDYITYLDPQKNITSFPYRNIIDNQNHIEEKIFDSYPKDQKIILNPASVEKSSNDCKVTASEKPEKEISNGVVKYTSIEGSFCDHFSFTTLPRNQAYLIALTSRNLSGLPLRFCVSNYISNRCDLYTQLSTHKSFQKDLFLLPPLGNGVGLDINLDNFGIKKSTAVNELKSIEILPFPYDQLSQLESYKNTNEEKNVNVLATFQSFDKGWMAYEVKNGEKKELSDHVLVDNWANGWIVDDPNSEFLIVFEPQYLEYFGFIALGVVFSATFLALFIDFPKLKERILYERS